jgi:hypothetical protein
MAKPNLTNQKTLSASAIIVYGIDATGKPKRPRAHSSSLFATSIDQLLSKSLRKFRSDAFTTKAVASALHQTQLVRERHDRITGSRA